MQFRTRAPAPRRTQIFGRFPGRCPSPGWPNAVIDACGTEVAYPEHSGPLTLKCVFSGQETYDVRDVGPLVVRPGWFLILNHGQRYSSAIASTSTVESFSVFFAADLVAEVSRAHDLTESELLDEPEGDGVVPRFQERLQRDDHLVAPAVARFRRALRGGKTDEPWLAEKLRDLVCRLLPASQRPPRPWDPLPAARESTRRELYRRLMRARDFLESAVGERVTLEAVARAACLSPFHLQRSFRSAFGLTPHAYLIRMRLQRAKALLRETDEAISTICCEVGFESLGSFSAMFTRAVGLSPSAYRVAARGEGSDR